MKVLAGLIAFSTLLCAFPASSQYQTRSAADTPNPADQARLEVIRHHIDAYRARDLDRFVASFAPDAEVYANGIRAKGHNEIRALYRLNFAPNTPKIRIQGQSTTPDFIILTVGYILPTGEEICCSISEYEVIGGKITYLSASA